MSSKKNKPVAMLDASGPLTRELTSIKMLRLVETIHRSAQLAFTRVSGLSDFQWRVIARVNEVSPLSINQLSDMLQRDVGQVSRTVKGMVEAGLLHRATRKGGPGVLITPTQAGRAVYGPVKRLARKRNQLFLSGLSTEEVGTFEHFLGVVTRNAKILLAQEVALARRESPGSANRRTRRGTPVAL